MKRLSTVSPLRAVRGLLVTGAVAAALVLGSAGTASAQINFAGTTSFRLGTSGAFSSSLSFGGSPSNGITFQNTGFNVTTVGNQWLSFSNIGSSMTNALGAVALRDRRNIYDGTIVQMLVTLASPTAPAQVFSSLLSGTIYTCTGCDPTQSVSIAWASGSNLPYTNGPGSGNYDLEVDDTTVLVGVANAVAITGNVTVTTPEPASMALIATGLVGIFGVARRRRSQKA